MFRSFLFLDLDFERSFTVEVLPIRCQGECYSLVNP